MMVDPLKVFWVLTNSTYLGNVEGVLWWCGSECGGGGGITRIGGVCCWKFWGFGSFGALGFWFLELWGMNEIFILLLWLLLIFGGLKSMFFKME